MKKVFLIGDSIRYGLGLGARPQLGYGYHIVSKTGGKYEVYQPNENCRYAIYTLRYLSKWAADCGVGEDVDVVHWNNGLWDCVHLYGDELATEPEQYGRYIRRIYQRIREVFPNAKIIFATSTPVLDDRCAPGFQRSNAEIRMFNQVAVDALKPYDVSIDDLYSVAEKLPESMRHDTVHFNSEGAAILADAVVASIGKVLGEKI